MHFEKDIFQTHRFNKEMSEIEKNIALFTYISENNQLELMKLNRAEVL